MQQEQQTKSTPPVAYIRIILSAILLASCFLPFCTCLNTSVSIANLILSWGRPDMPGIIGLSLSDLVLPVILMYIGAFINIIITILNPRIRGFSLYFTSYTLLISLAIRLNTPLDIQPGIGLILIIPLVFLIWLTTIYEIIQHYKEHKWLVLIYLFLFTLPTLILPIPVVLIAYYKLYRKSTITQS